MSIENTPEDADIVLKMCSQKAIQAPNSWHMILYHRIADIWVSTFTNGHQISNTGESIYAKGRNKLTYTRHLNPMTAKV